MFGAHIQTYDNHNYASEGAEGLMDNYANSKFTDLRYN